MPAKTFVMCTSRPLSFKNFATMIAVTFQSTEACQDSPGILPVVETVEHLATGVEAFGVVV